MTKEQYINPECEKFTISGVDYYVHPKFTPLGISMNAEVVNVRTLHVPKQTARPDFTVQVGVYIPSTKKTNTFTLRLMLALAFLPIKEGCSVARRKYSDDDSYTIDNTEWCNEKNENSSNVVLMSVADRKVLWDFSSRASAHRFIQENDEWKIKFSSAVQVELSRKKLMTSKCGAYQLISA